MKKIYNLSKWIIPLVSLLFMSTIQLFAQTTLAKGDLSIVGFNSNSPDGFAFVTWVDLSAGTVIKFTDNGFNSSANSNAAANYREQEQYIVWTNNTGAKIDAGTIITIEAGAPTSVTNKGVVTSVTNSSNGSNATAMALINTAGDQIFAFQGAGGPSTGILAGTFSGTLLFGLGYSGSTGTTTNWVSTGNISGSTSYLPSDLSGTSQIFLGPNIVAGQYTGPTSGEASLAAYKALVANPSKWTTVTSPLGTVALTTSGGTTFTAGTPPSITTQPSASAICTGGNAAFSVVASNASTYQWQISTVGAGGPFINLTNGGIYSGVTTATLTITGATAAQNGYAYKCVVTGTASPEAVSNSATLTVNVAPAITNQPSASAICAGGNTAFTVSASNATGYQWYVDQGAGFSAISNSAPYSGVTTATLTITGATAGLSGYLYRVVASGGCAPTATSNNAALTVNTAPVITNQPSASAICAGGNTTFTVVASNATGYLWQVNSGSGFTNISNGGIYSGATTATLTITGATAGLSGYAYRVITTGTCTPQSVSTSAALTVNTAPAITTQPSAGTICAGGNTTFTVVASNATAFQWQVDEGAGFAPISNGAPYSGATSATLTITGATAGLNGYLYRVVASGGCAPTATSNNAALTVNTAPAIINHPSASTICAGGNTAFTVTASNVTGYQWEVNSGSGFTNISNGGVYSGATTATLTITNATAGLNGYLYRVVAAGGCTPTATSNNAALTVNTAPVITNQPSAKTICAGENTTFIVSASNTTGYQWQVNSGSGFTNINNGGVYSGATTATLAITNATASLTGYSFRVIATGTCSPNATSASAVLTVNTAPVITNQPSAKIVCAGGNTTFAISASNATGYTWQVNSGSGFTNISNGAPYSGATTSTLTITNATTALNGFLYRAVVTGACSPDATSTSAALTVNPIPTVTATPVSAVICSGESAVIELTSTPSGGTFSWTTTTASGTITGASAGSNVSADISQVLTGKGVQTYTITTTVNACVSTSAATASITVNQPASFVNIPSAKTICAGATTTFAVTASNATGYQWQVDQGSGFENISNGGVYSGATTATLTIADATGSLNGYLYRVVAKGACAPDATSSSALLTVNTAPAITTQPVTSTICNGSDASFSVVASGATGYQWQENQGTGFLNVSNGGVYSGATTATLTITAPPTSMNGYMYRVIITGICSPNVTSTGATLSTTDLVDPVIAGCPSDITLNVTAGTCGAIATWTVPTATDNCTAATLTADHASGDVFNTGTTLVTYTATDVAGNTSTCSFTIIVTDNEKPVFTTACPDDVTIEAGVYTYTIPVATDNCSGVTVTKTAGLGSGATFPEGTSVETYEAKDASGNTVSCSFTITATTVATDTKAGALAFVRVYPNPTSDFVYVTSNVSSGDVYSVSLQDLTGKIIFQSNFNADNNFKLDVSHLSKGIYFLNIGNGSNMKVEKIIVE